MILKKNIEAEDDKNNIIYANYAEYYENNKVFKTLGETKIKTSDEYLIEGKDIIFDSKKSYISSNEKTIIKDEDENKIHLENFEYSTQNNIFKSLGLIEIKDKNENKYQFSQIYIDTKKKEILGTDIKAFINQKKLQI